MRTTVAAALAQARQEGVAALDARALLAQIVGTTRTGLIAGDDRALDSAQVERWRDSLRRRAAGEPLAYLLGEKEFYAMTLEVGPDVLVPRPETELLVDWALELLGRTLPSTAEVLDLGTGSGAIALAIKQQRAMARVAGSDRSGAALTIARSNAARHRLDIEFALGDWWQPWSGRRFGVVVANPPYVAAEDPHLRALRHEPQAALLSGADGLDALTTIIAGAAAHLHRGGHLLVEHGSTQAAAVAALFEHAGFDVLETRLDLAGLPRASGGRLGSADAGYTGSHPGAG